MGLLTIVMFTGVLGQDSGLRKVLTPIRAELSIIASLLTLGHAIKYGEAYFGQLLSSTSYMPSVRIWSVAIAIVMLLLLIPLAITSTRLVHAKMGQRSWQRLQRLAYSFYSLIFIHRVAMSLPFSHSLPAPWRPLTPTP